MQVCVWSEYPLNSPRAVLVDVAILSDWWKGLGVLLEKLFVSRERNRSIITLKHNLVNSGKLSWIIFHKQFHKQLLLVLTSLFLPWKKALSFQSSAVLTNYLWYISFPARLSDLNLMDGVWVSRTLASHCSTYYYTSLPCRTREGSTLDCISHWLIKLQMVKLTPFCMSCPAIACQSQHQLVYPGQLNFWLINCLCKVLLHVTTVTQVVE